MQLDVISSGVRLRPARQLTAGGSGSAGVGRPCPGVECVTSDRQLTGMRSTDRPASRPTDRPADQPASQPTGRPTPGRQARRACRRGGRRAAGGGRRDRAVGQDGEWWVVGSGRRAVDGGPERWMLGGG